MRGTVKSFAKGYGFITAASGSDVFVHWTEIRGQRRGHRSLSPGQTVDFEVVDTPRGLRAVDVRVVDVDGPSCANHAA